PAGELGISFQLVDVKEGDFQTQSLRVDLGFRGGYEYRFQYYPTPGNLPDVTIAAPTGGFSYRYAFTKETVLEDDLTAVLNLPDGGPRLLLHNTITFSARLLRSLTLPISHRIPDTRVPPRARGARATTARKEAPGHDSHERARVRLLDAVNSLQLAANRLSASLPPPRRPSWPRRPGRTCRWRFRARPSPWCCCR